MGGEEGLGVTTGQPNLYKQDLSKLVSVDLNRGVCYIPIFLRLPVPLGVTSIFASYEPSSYDSFRGLYSIKNASFAYPTIFASF